MGGGSRWVGLGYGEGKMIVEMGPGVGVFGAAKLNVGTLCPRCDASRLEICLRPSSLK